MNYKPTSRVVYVHYALITGVLIVGLLLYIRGAEFIFVFIPILGVLVAELLIFKLLVLKKINLNKEAITIPSWDISSSLIFKESNKTFKLSEIKEFIIAPLRYFDKLASTKNDSLLSQKLANYRQAVMTGWPLSWANFFSRWYKFNMNLGRILLIKDIYSNDHLLGLREYKEKDLEDLTNNLKKLNVAAKFITSQELNFEEYPDKPTLIKQLLNQKDYKKVVLLGLMLLGVAVIIVMAIKDFVKFSS